MAGKTRSAKGEQFLLRCLPSHPLLFLQPACDVGEVS